MNVKMTETINNFNKQLSDQKIEFDDQIEKIKSEHQIKLNNL